MSTTPLTTSHPSGSDADLEAAVERQYRRARRLKTRDLGLAIATPILLLTLWEIAAQTGLIDSRLYSPPSAIGIRGWEMVASGDLWIHVGATIARLAVGFIAGSAAGIVVGLLMGL
ncbi:MAG: ABC transporter permease, partial [Microbacterium sp.]